MYRGLDGELRVISNVNEGARKSYAITRRPDRPCILLNQRRCANVLRLSVNLHPVAKPPIIATEDTLDYDVLFEYRVEEHYAEELLRPTLVILDRSGNIALSSEADEFYGKIIVIADIAPKSRPDTEQAPPRGLAISLSFNYSQTGLYGIVELDTSENFVSSAIIDCEITKRGLGNV